MLTGSRCWVTRSIRKPISEMPDSTHVYISFVFPPSVLDLRPCLLFHLNLVLVGRIGPNCEHTLLGRIFDSGLCLANIPNILDNFDYISYPQTV